MAAEFLQPDTGKIYIKPADGLPFFLVVQVSSRRFAVAQFDSNASGDIPTTYVLVSAPMSYDKANQLCRDLTDEKHEALAPHYHNPAR